MLNLEILPQELVYFIMLVASTLNFLALKTDLPFFNRRCNLLAKFQVFGFVLFSYSLLSLSVCNFFTKLSASKNIHIAFGYFISVFFVGLATFVISNFRSADEQSGYLFCDIKDPISYADKLEFCRYILANHSASEELNGILNSLLDIHYEEMSSEQKRKLLGILSESKGTTYQKEEVREFIKFVHDKYLSGIRRFKANNLLVSYCFFLKETDTSINKKKKIGEHSALIIKSFFSSYEIYCLSQYEDELSKKSGRHHGDKKKQKPSIAESHGQDLEVQERDKKAQVFYHLMLKSVKAAQSLMAILSEESPDLADMLNAYTDFGSKKLKVAKEWARQQSVLQDNAELLERYGIYLKHVLHNAKHGDRMLRDARAVQEKDKLGAGKIGNLDLKNLIEKIAHISHPLLILKYENSEIVIENCNQCFCNIIRYKRFEILEKSKQVLPGLRPILLRQQYLILEYSLRKKEAIIPESHKVSLYFVDRNGAMQECLALVSVGSCETAPRSARHVAARAQARDRDNQSAAEQARRRLERLDPAVQLCNRNGLWLLQVLHRRQRCQTP